MDRCLRRWAEPRGRGIPQGLSASDVLGKLYLAPVDEELRRQGFSHIRYVDDFRVFCKSLEEAQLALLVLERQLRLRGLNLGSSKTQILSAARASQYIEGFVPKIAQIEKSIRGSARAEVFSNPYSTAEDYEQLETAEAEAVRGMLEEAFEKYVVNSAQFDKSLFHYLLHRLAKLESQKAATYCLNSLVERPDETPECVKYLARFAEDETLMHELVQVANRSIYSYQKYVVARELLDNQARGTAVLEYGRRLAHDLSAEPWLRSRGLRLLARLGDPIDLEGLEARYYNADSTLERAEILCAIQRMVPVKRNSIYARSGSDSPMSASAVKWARNEHNHP